jgi:hypothetical protein
MFINKYAFIVSILLISLFVFLNLAGKTAATQYCTLDIYVKDQNGHAINANIYVDDSYKDYDDHITFTVELGSYKIEARKTDYESDVETVTCSCSDTKTVDLTIRKIEEETDISIGSLKLDPDYICSDEEIVRMSIPVTLEHGDDDTFIVAKFYVQENDGKWHYIDKDEEYLDRGQTKTFSIDFYHYYLLDEGTHDVKVKIESDDFQRTAFSELQVNDCFYGKTLIDVGSIEVDNEYPNKGDILQVSVPITLDYPRMPQTAYVYGYVDDSLVNSVNMKFDSSDTKIYQFTIDTDKYSTGPHTIKVKADFKGRTDTSTKTFSAGPFGYYPKGTEHCLSIDNIWTDDDLKPGERNKVNVRVLSCGTKYENSVKMKLEAFSKTYYTGEFYIPYGGSKDVFVTVTVPEDVSEKQTFKITVWNSYTSDTWSKEFDIATGIPFIEIKPEFVLEECQQKRIIFDIINNGKISDTFTISLTGSAAEWATGVPETITLNPGEKKIVNVYMSVPCGIEPGFYEFTITAKGSPEHSVTSTIHVIKSLRWPVIFPTGFFINVGGIFWLLPWIIIILLILFLLLFFSGYITLINSRRRPMFDCYNCHGC